ncbi:NADPH-dependent FMN reductase [Flavobacterium sp. '19STA2R22 D10 B1']|uniref:NADPH-dependent FMN reductase n=1 Tax=Flavobacterium aerium TaxID=3037261 RepID=UPI00278C7FF2|nr:NADPH-dependent FMN reductase [Flavobacterium sp. '19STA2R22 D10 B1']
MNILLFNGSIDIRPHTAAFKLSDYLEEQFRALGHEVVQFNVGTTAIPFLDFTNPEIPTEVQSMCDAFLKADVHIWLAPLYHGGMPGIMKNCLDWLEITSKNTNPYLTDKLIGLICWADGGYALNGINGMESVAKSLRAWVHPYSVPIIKSDLFKDIEHGHFSEMSKNRLNRMVHLLTTPRQELK